MVEDCKWDVQVDKSVLLLRFPGYQKFNNSEYERLLSCDLINLKNCPIETQRYFALTDWVKKLPWLEWSGNSLKSFFDGIISQANAYKEKIGFVKTTLKTLNNTILIKNDQIESSLILKSTDFKMKFLNGTDFEIELGWTLKADKIIYNNDDNNSWNLTLKEAINLVNFSFYYDNYSEIHTPMILDPSTSIISKTRLQDNIFESINNTNKTFVEFFK